MIFKIENMRITQDVIDKMSNEDKKNVFEMFVNFLNFLDKAQDINVSCKATINSAPIRHINRIFDKCIEEQEEKRIEEAELEIEKMRNDYCDPQDDYSCETDWFRNIEEE